jgi:hypothetical protein
MSTEEGSITRCLGLLRAGDPGGAQLIWDRYFRRLVALARSRLRAGPSGDGEDVVVEVFDTFLRNAGEGASPDWRIGSTSGRSSSS